MASNKPKRESSPGTPGASTPTLMSSLQTCDRTSAAVTSSEKQCPLPCLPRAHGHHALGPPRPDVGFPTDCSEMPVGVHRELSSDVWPWRQRGPRRRAARPHSRCPPAVAELPRPSPPWLWLMSHSGSQRSGLQVPYISQVVVKDPMTGCGRTARWEGPMEQGAWGRARRRLVPKSLSAGISMCSPPRKHPDPRRPADIWDFTGASSGRSDR